MRRAQVMLACSLLLASTSPAFADWPASGLWVSGPSNTNGITSVQIQDAPLGRLMLITGHRGGNFTTYNLQQVSKDGSYVPGWQPNGKNVWSTGVGSAFQGFTADDSGGVWAATYTTSPLAIYAMHLLDAGSAEPASLYPGWTVQTGITYSVDAARAPGSDVYLAPAGKLRRYTRAGVMAAGWPAAGRVMVSSGIANAMLEPDGAGGVLYLNSYFDTPRLWRIDPDANSHVGWPATGVVLGSGTGSQMMDWPAQRIIRSGTDAVIVVWSEGTHPIYRMKLQRVRLDGTLDPTWPVGGFEAVSLDSLKNVTVVPDGLGGVHVVWEKSGLPRGTHVLANGAFAPGCDADGVSLLPATAQYQRMVWYGGSATYMVAAQGLNGGLIFAWDDAGQSPECSIRVRWLKSDLTPDPIESEAGRLIVVPSNSSAIGSRLRAGLGDGAGGLYLAWMYTEDSPDPIYDYSWLRMTHVIPTGLVGVDPPVTGIHAAFALRTPTPNPARSSVALSFTLPDDRPGTLELFDVSGRVRASRRVAGAGDHVESFDGLGQFAPGVYLVRLTHVGDARSARVVLMP